MDFYTAEPSKQGRQGNVCADELWMLLAVTHTYQPSRAECPLYAATACFTSSQAVETLLPAVSACCRTEESFVAGQLLPLPSSNHETGQRRHQAKTKCERGAVRAAVVGAWRASLIDRQCRSGVAGAAREAAADNLPEGYRQVDHDHHPDRRAVVEQQPGLVGAGRAGAVGDAAAVLRQALAGAVVCGTRRRSEPATL